VFGVDGLSAPDELGCIWTEDVSAAIECRQHGAIRFLTGSPLDA